MSGSRLTRGEADIRRIRSGQLDNIKTVTLTTGTTTLVEDPRLSYSGAFLLDPITATAAAEHPYSPAADRTNGAVLLRHAAGAADRTYRMVIFG